MEQPSGIPRPSSGIPRPTSRLPVLRPSGSQSQLRSPSSTEQLRKKPSLSSVHRASQPPPSLQKKPSVSSISRVGQPQLQKKPSLSSVSRVSQPPLQKKPSLSSISRPSQPPPSLQKKPSRTSLARSSIVPPATANTSSNRASILTTKRSISGLAPRNSVADTSALKKPTGYTLPQQPRARVQPTKPSYATQKDDVLGDLGGFRSASRASSRASSRSGFYDHEPQYALDIDEDAPGPAVRKSRPSLSDRTVESLSQLPSSPGHSKGRRRSSFFNNGDSMGPPLRPASALSNGRRPTTSDGSSRVAPVTPQKVQASQRGSMTVPRSISAGLTSASATPSKRSSIARAPSTIKKQPLSQVPNFQSKPSTTPSSDSKTMVTRTPKPRSSLAGTFGQAISPTDNTPVPTPPPAKKTPETTRKTANSSAALREQLAKAKATKRSEIASSADEPAPKLNSSQALRDQIAKARAAKRVNGLSPGRPRTNTPPRDAIIPDPVEVASFNFGWDDPFNQKPQGASVLRKRVDAARADGRLNLAGMDLKEIPEEVLKMYEYNPEANTAWGEVVDLTSMIVADNDLSQLPESMFPDVDYEAVMDSDEAVPQFGGIQNLDLHGNMLRELPAGLGRLPVLSKLNLSRNKMTIDSLEIVFQIATLRDLKLAENELAGALPASIEKLSSLETIELQTNQLSSLPPEIRALTQLKVLNVADNKLTSIPSDILTSTSLVDLNASKNSLSGVLLETDTIPNLQNLCLANNSLTSLCGSDTILLPSMKHLDVSMNRLSSLPDMATWTSLTTLLVGENGLSTFPEGFCLLKQLRNADFTANNINKMDERIAFMENLENLTLAANPLRERKFLTMNAEDIKRDLMSKVAPEAAADEDFLQDVAELEDENSCWKLTPSGTLDFSGQNLIDLDEEALSSFAESHDIKQLHLQQNMLIRIPLAVAQLSFLTVLDMSKNNMADPLSENLELPKLRELRLANNKVSSLLKITSMLSAPNLHHLDVSNNRIAGTLPTLRESFPELLTLLGSDNGIDEVSAESLKGLKIVNLSNNDIARLEPHIGLLAGTLTSLDVEGNKFRVPNYAVLKKGTDAVLAWLRDKVPSPTDEFDPGSPAF